jgi:hypothetical protein
MSGRIAAMKNKVTYFSFGWMVFALMTLMPEAGVAATCFCKISKDNLWGATAGTGICKDLTPNVARNFTGQSEPDQEACRLSCGPVAEPLKSSQSIAAACCAIGAPNGSAIRAFSAVGTKAYRPARETVSGLPIVIGILTNTPAITQAKCPAGWLANQTNVDGGVATDGRCKKLSGIMNITPSPPNGTEIGTYGFTWGNEVWTIGATANGGAAVTTTVTAAACHF